jgi:S1-C subfamily serine protease
MKKFQVAVSTATIVVVIASAARSAVGSWAASKTGKTSQVSATTSRVSFEDRFAPVVKRAVPAIVNVSSSKLIRNSGGNISLPSAEREHSLGSGVVVNSDGYIRHEGGRLD